MTTDAKGRLIISPQGENQPLLRVTLERCPPELAADLVDRGIMLAGGGALIRGVDKLLAEETGLPVHIADDPLSAVAMGTGAGAIIGGLIGGKKGAAIVALGGAGGSALYTYKLRKRSRRY